MSNFDDEIDIRPYVQSIIRNWWLIGLLIFISVGITAVISLLTPKVYESTATLLLNRARSSLELAVQFPTTDSTDPGARLSAVLAIAQSDVVAQKVFEAKKDELAAKNIQPNDLAGSVQVTSEGDLILVTANDNDPTFATEIANEWAKQAVSLVNQAYSGEQPLEKIQEQLVIARGEYQVAQDELVNFLKNNKLDILDRKISTAQSILDTLISNKALRINYYNQRRMDIEALKVEAEALKQQLQTGGQSKAAQLGDALAVLQVRANALGLHRNLDLSIGAIDKSQEGNSTQGDKSTLGNLQTAENSSTSSKNQFTINLQPGDLEAIQGDPKSYMDDLENLITIFGQDEERLGKAIALISEDVSGDAGQENVELIAAQLQEMQAQQAQDEAQRRELTNRRDLTEQAYRALAQKETEIKNAVQATNQVSLVSSAIPGTEPAPRGTLKKIFIAAALGLILGEVWVFFRNWWKSTGQSG